MVIGFGIMEEAHLFKRGAREKCLIGLGLFERVGVSSSVFRDTSCIREEAGYKHAIPHLFYIFP